MAEYGYDAGMRGLPLQRGFALHACALGLDITKREQAFLRAQPVTWMFDEQDLSAITAKQPVAHCHFGQQKRALAFIRACCCAF